MITVYGLKQCSTTQKVIKFLEKNGLEIGERLDIRDTPPSKELVQLALAATSGKPRQLMNSSGGLYREMGLKDLLADMSEDEIAELLTQHGMLIKRPFITDGRRVSFGSKEAMLTEIWELNN